MDFAAMKRKELQALCKRHGLPGGGTNADLVARLTATLSGSGAAAEEAVGVVVGKGCLKRSAAGANGGDLDAAKKVTFELEEDEEAEVGATGRGRRRSQVLSSPAVAKTRGRVKAVEALPSSEGNGGERRRTLSQDVGDTTDESDSGEAGADAKTRGRGKAPPASKGNGGERRQTRSQASGDSADESDSGEAGADVKTRGRAKAPPVSKGNGSERRRTRSQAGGDSADESDYGEAGADAKTRGSGKAGEEAPPASKGNGGERRRTRSQAGGDSADEIDSGEAGPDAKTRGRGKAGEAPPAAKGNGADRRRTRSQAGGDSADESDSGEAGADAPVRRTRRNPVNLGAGDGAERIAEAVTRKNSAKIEQEEVNVGDAVGRKHQLKRKTRENDIEDVDVSGQVGVSRRSTRSSSLQLEPDTVFSPVEKKRGRRKASNVKEKTCVQEQPTEALHSGRTLRSGVVVVAPVPPIVSESKRSRRDVQEEKPAVEKVAEVEISRRTTRSSAVAAPLTSPSVIAKKRGRKTDDVHSDGGLDKKMENKRQSSRLTTRSGIHHLASTEETSLEQVAAPSKGLPPRQSRRNPSEANVMLSSNTTSESSRARPTLLNAAKDGVEKLDERVGVKKSKLRKDSAIVATSGGEIPFSDNSSKASATDMQIEVPGPVRRSTRKSVVPSSLEYENNDMHEDVEKKQTVTKPAGRSTRGSVAPVILEKESKGLNKEIVSVDAEKKQTLMKPVGRSTRRSVASGLTKEIVSVDVAKKQTVTKPVGRSTRKSVPPVMLEKESKGLTKEMVPEAHVKRPTQKSVVPAMLEKGRKSVITEIIAEAGVKRSTRKPALPIVNSENNDRCEVVSTENLQSGKSEELEKQPTVKQPVRRLTWKSAVPAMLEKARKGVPDMLNNENSDSTEMQSDQVGHLEKQLVVKEQVRRSMGKSVVPDVIAKENKSLHEELKSEVSVRTPVCKSVVPNVVNKENKDHNEFVRREELSVKTRSMHTSLQVALQNDESPRRTTRQSSKLVLSSPQTKPIASKGRPAKRRRTASLQESMPVKEQKEDHKNDVIEASTSTDMEIGVLPVTVEKSDLRDSQFNSELEGLVVVEPGLSREDDHDILEFKLEGTVGATEKSPSSSPIQDRQHGVTERSATRNAIPCPGYRVVESDLHKVECLVETVVSSESDSYQGSDENSVSVEKSGGCVFSSQQNDEQGVSVSGCAKDSVVSAQLDQSEDVDHVVREEEKKDFIPSDINVPHETVNEPAENEKASGVSGAVFCISQSIPISDEVKSDSSPLESPHALNNRIPSSSTEEVQQDNKEEHNLHNGVTHGIHASGMSEAAQVDVSKSGKMLLPDVETSSAFRDSQLNRRWEGSEFEAHSFSCDNDSSGKNNMSQLANEYVVYSCQEQELKLPHDLSGVKSLKMSTTCPDELGSGIGRTTGSVVKENSIAMDAPGTAMQGDLSPSATDLLRNREETPLEGTLENTALCSATPEGKHEFGFPDKAEPHSLKEICSASVEQLPFGLQSHFMQDDAQGQEGTPEKASQGSVTPEGKHECGLPDEAEPHSSKNERCSTSVEQSPFGVQSLLSQESIEEPSENVALAVNAKNGVDESKDTQVEYRVQKPPVPEYVSDHDSGVDLIAVSKSEEGLTKSCHEQKQMACQLDLLEAANCMKDFTNPEEVSYNEENKRPVHSTDISSSCEKIDANEPDKHSSGLGDVLLSSSLIASTDDTDVDPRSNPNQFESIYFLDDPKGAFSTEALHQGLKQQCDEPKENHVTLLSSSLTASNDDSDVHPSPNPSQFESTDFLDEPKRCSSTEALEQGLRELCDEPKENQVTHGACPSDMIEADTAKELDSEVPPLPAEEASNMPEYSFLRESSKGFDMSGDLVLPSGENEDDSNSCHAEQQVEKIVSSEPDSSKGSDMHGDLVLPSAEDKGDSIACHVEPQVEKMVSSEPDFSKGSEMHGDLVLPSAENKDDSITCHVELQVEKMFSSEPCSHQGSHEDLTLAEGIRGCMLSSHSQPEHEKDEQLIASLLAGETSALPDEQTNPELEAGELEKCNFSSEDTSQLENEKNDQLIAPLLAAETSALRDQQAKPELEVGECEKFNFSSEDTSGKIGTGYVKTNLLQLHEDSRNDPNQGEDLLNDLPAPQSPEQSSVGQDAETSALPDEQPSPELEGGEFEECKIGTGYVKTNLFQLHEDSRNDHNQGEDLLNDLPAPQSPEQSTVGHYAETSALLDEQSSPELEGGEFEECKLRTGTVKTNLFQLHEDSCNDPNQEEELLNDLPAPKSPEQSTVGHDAETFALPDEQPSPELEGGEFEDCKLGSGNVKTNLFQLHEDSCNDPNQEEELLNDLPAPISPEQSTVGLDAETSALLDEQPSPELEGGEFEECKLGTGNVKTNLFQLHEDSCNDPNQEEELLNDVPAPKSPEQSTVGQDAETSALPDEQPSPELQGGEFEECNFSSEDAGGLFDTGYLEDDLFQLNEYSPPTDPIQGEELPNYLLAPKSPKQSTLGLDENVLGSETSPLPDEKLDPELEGGEFKEANYSCDGAASYIFSSGSMKNNTCHWDDKDDYNERNDQAATPMLSSGMAKPTLIVGSESPKQSTIGLDENVIGSETSPVQYEKFDPELEGGELEEPNHSSDEAASYIFSSGSVKNNTCHWDDKEQYNEHNYQATAAMLSSGMTKQPARIEGSESGTSVAGTPALTDELLISKLEDDKEQNLCFDTDTSNISVTGLMEDSNLLFNLPEDAHTQTCYEHELPIGTPAAKSAVESAVCPDGSVPGSVGFCQTSGRRRVDEISTKLLRFKISSTIKGSYIAMDSSKKKQGDNLSPICLLGNMENVPAANADDPAELNTAPSVAEDSSSQGTNDGL